MLERQGQQADQWETHAHAHVGSPCPQVTEGQGGYREVSKTTKRRGWGSGSASHGPGGAAGPWDPLLGQAPQGAGAEDSVFQELCSQLAQGQIQVLPLSYWVTLDKMPPGASVSLRVC